MGRPAFEPTKEQRDNVRTLSGLGIPQEDICLLVKDKAGKPISVDTLAKYFADEIKAGVTEANAKIAGRLFKSAMEGNTACMIFWLKTRARWSETPQKLAITDADGKDKPAAATLADLYGIMASAAKPEGAEGASDGGA